MLETEVTPAFTRSEKVAPLFLRYLRTWLYGIAFRVAQDDRRRRARETRSADSEAEPLMQPDVYAERV